MWQSVSIGSIKASRLAHRQSQQLVDNGIDVETFHTAQFLRCPPEAEWILTCDRKGADVENRSMFSGEPVLRTVGLT
jgi:hypothetical protein